MTPRRFLPWIAVLALGMLGWYAMVPLWTGGLGMVALDANGQPALWFWAAKMAIVLGVGPFVLDRGAFYLGGKPLLPAYRVGLILGTGMFALSTVLFLAMAGQPLRAWFLGAHFVFGNWFVWGAFGYAACLAALALGGVGPRKLMMLFSLLGLAGFVFLIPSLLGTSVFLAMFSSILLVILCAGNRLTDDVRTGLEQRAGMWLLLSAAQMLLHEEQGWWLFLGVFSACFFLRTRFFQPWSVWLSRWMPLLLSVGYLLFPLANAAPPFAQEWLVLAFALGCGAYAAWLRARRLSHSGEAAMD